MALIYKLGRFLNEFVNLKSFKLLFFGSDYLILKASTSLEPFEFAESGLISLAAIATLAFARRAPEYLLPCGKHH